MLLVFKFTLIYRQDTILTPHFLCQKLKPKIKSLVEKLKHLCVRFNTPMDFVLLFKEEDPVYAMLAYISILALIVKTKGMGQINVFGSVLPENLKNKKKDLPNLGLNHDPSNIRGKLNMLFFQ